MRKKLKYSIKKIESFEDYIVVLLEVPSDVIYNENVFVFNDSEQLLWQISADIVNKYKIHDDEPFVGFDFNHRRKLVLYNWGGWKIEVDLNTGECLKHEVTK